MKRVATAQRPALGQRIAASGYMVRYLSPGCGGYEQQGCHGWRRKTEPLSGAYVGMRRLVIGWWSPSMAEEDRGFSTIRPVGGIRVYAVAVNHQCIRYVLPGDASCVSAEGD